MNQKAPPEPSRKPVVQSGRQPLFPHTKPAFQPPTRRPDPREERAGEALGARVARDSVRRVLSSPSGDPHDVDLEPILRPSELALVTLLTLISLATILSVVFWPTPDLRHAYAFDLSSNCVSEVGSYRCASINGNRIRWRRPLDDAQQQQRRAIRLTAKALIEQRQECLSDLERLPPAISNYLASLRATPAEPCGPDPLRVLLSIPESAPPMTLHAAAAPP